jgi:mannose-6-phosphate isomerase-like protein (cupin superfamily)
MATREPVNLLDSYVQLQPTGAGDVMVKATVGVTRDNGDTVVWDPQVEGLLASEAEMSESSRHGGERHLDADEFVYLVSGAARIALEPDQGDIEELTLSPGRAVLVPQGAWHRVLIEQPSRLLFVNAGRTEIRPPR